MRRFRRAAKGLTLIALGGFVAQVGCLPKDYWWKFATNGQLFLLDVFADTVYTAVADAIFPGSDDDDDDDNGNTN
jgi:hypothetical protein